MKRFLIILIALVFISGCTSETEKSDKVELEFWTLQLSAYKDYIQSMIAEYESNHPDVKIKWLDVPFKEGEKRALAAAMSNKIPDIINLNPTFSSTLASKKALINFNDYLTEEEKASYLPESLQASSLGKMIFGLPWYMTSSITIYNQKDLKAAQIKVPPSTYDELISQAKIIKTKLNHYAFLPSITEGDYFLKVLVKNDIPIISETDPNKVVFNSKEAVKILEEWVELYSQNYISPESIVATHQEAVDKFQSGTTTFIIIGPNFLKSIQDNAPELYQKINVSPQIVGKARKVDFSVMNLIVPIKSRHKKEAVQFALFVTNKKNQLEFSKLTPTLPSNLEALEDNFFTQTTSKTLEEKARTISATQLRNGAKALPVLRSQQELLSILNYYIQKALLKKMSPKKALDSACKQWEEILAK